MKKKLALILAVIMLVSLFTGFASAAVPAGKLVEPLMWNDFDGNLTDFGAWYPSGEVKAGAGVDGSAAAVVTTDGYGATYFWTHIQDTSSYYVSFVAKGVAGENINWDFSESFGGGEYTFQATDVWEEVSFVVTPPAATDAGTGFSFRTYTTEGYDYAIDNLTIGKLVADPNYTLPDYSTAANTEDGGFALLTPSGAGDSTQYGAWYFRTATFEAATYEVKADVKVNVEGINVMVDVEGGGGAGGNLTPATVDAWETITTTVAPTADGDIRIYVNETDGTVGQVAVKNVIVTKEGAAEPIISWTGEVKEGDFIGQCNYITKKVAAPELTNLFTLEEVNTEDYLALQPNEANGYAAYYMRAKLKKNTEYTITFDMISNTTEISAMVDLEGNGGIGAEKSVTNSVADKWEKMTVTIKPTENYSESSNKDIKEMGWPLRVYVNKPINAQVFIDNIQVKGGGKTILKQDFAEAGIEGIVTWNGGNAVHIPVGYVPYQEGEVLGFNEIVNGDFENAYLMSYWWARKDWNGGTFAREEGKGFDGSAGLVARGTGAGTADQNAGCFYSLYGEGHEATLDISAGKTYVLTYKVFRPAGVDSYTYIDINEGSAVNGTATKNGEWETVSARFVAPKGALKIRLVVNALADGEYVVFDDIELRQVGGDPNGNPKTDDNMMLGFVVAAMAVSAIGVAVVSKKRVLSK